METEELMAAKKLREHFPTFARLLRIKTKDGDVKPLILKPAQIRLWKTIQQLEADGRPVRIIILKARQLGFSTFVQGYLLWKAITQPGNNGLVVAHQEEIASDLFGKIEMMYDNLPEELLLPLEQIKDTKKRGKKLQFGGDLNTMLYVDTANNPALGRGQTFQHVHLSEMAFYAKPDEIMFGLSQSVPYKPGTTIIVESTANGMGNYFHSMWNTAEENKSGYIPLFFPWFEDSEYRLPAGDDFRLSKGERKMKKQYKLDNDQLMWRRNMIMTGCDGDVEKFQQENPADPTEAFLISGRPYFDRLALRYYGDRCKDPLREGSFVVKNGRAIFEDQAEGHWRIYSKPDRNASYIIGADVASGSARDYSAAHVVNSQTLEVVATFHARIDPHEFARQLKWAGLLYNKALLVVERNGEGRAVVLKLINDMHYPRMFYHQTEEAWSGGVQQSWGWSTNSRTRPTMIAQLKELIKERQLKMYDDRTLRDLESFVSVDTSKIAEASKGAWDDMVMSLALAVNSEARSQGVAYGEFDSGDYKPTVSDVTMY